ncbi:TonB-dependent receptor [bacterium]|nr:TonB-dependent receptor [bacterium]
MKKPFLFLFGLFFVWSALFADEDLFLKLDKVLIETQYKMPTNYTKISENVYLFDEEFLIDQNITILKDLIQLLSRTYYSRYRSGTGLIFANGIINSHNERFLLLIDGIPINDPFYNQSYVDEYYPLINIKQIEVSFGPFSSLYGTGGVAGYINIVHNKNGTKKISFEMGNSEKFQPNIVIGLKKETLNMGITMSYLNDKGIGVDKNLKSKPVLINDYPKENIFISGYIQSKDLQLKIISIGYRTFELNNPVYTWDDVLMNRVYNYDFRDMFFILNYDHTFKNNLQIKTSIDYFTYNRNSVWGYSVYNSTEIVKTVIINPKKISEKVAGEFLLSYVKNDLFNILCGVNWEYIMLKDIKDYEYINNSDTFEDPSSYYLDPINYFNYAPFAQVGVENLFKYFNLILSARYDYNHFSQGFISPKITVGYNLMKIFHFGFIYGKAFRSPTPREMLIKTASWVEGNTDLKPEEIESFSFTVKYLHRYFYIFTDIFKQELINLIQKVEIGPGQYRYENVGVEYIWGGNIFFETSIKKLKFTFDITYTDAKVEDKVQYDYPAIKSTQTLTYDYNDNFNISFANIYIGERERDSWNPIKSDGKAYWLNNINFNFHTLNIKASLFIKNIFDTKYYTMYYVEKVTSSSYNNDLEMPGRTFGAKVAYEF